MQFNQGSHVLPSLLSILHDNKPGSIPPGDSVVNASTISLICKLLYKEDYVDVAEQLNQAEDVKNLLDFILHLLRGLPGDDMGLKRRARRLMFKIISRMPVIPSSLILTGVSMPEKRDYIGSGGFGRVFKGELQGAIVALKVLYKSGNDVAFCREALMWRSLTHKFVLPFLGIYELEDGTIPQFFLVSPYMTNGNLAQWRKKVNPSVAEVKERILEVAQGMEYIHSEGAVHGDLRGENILLDADLHVQIADFGLTRHSEATNTRSGGLHVNFAAPELFGFCEDEDDSSDDVPARTQMSDVYAFGCLYYEIHYDSTPFAGKQDLQILTLISRGILPSRLDEPPLSDRAWSVIRCCWVREASERPKMKEITENMMSVTLPMSLPTKARDSFQELFELRTIPAQTLTVLRGGLDDRDPSRMTSAQRHQYRQQRRSDSAGPTARLQPRNSSQLRWLPQQLKRSHSETQEVVRGVGRIGSSLVQKHPTGRRYTADQIDRSISAPASETYARERIGQNPYFARGPGPGPPLWLNLKVNVEFAQAMRSLRLVDHIAAASATNEFADAYDYPSQRPLTEQPPTERIGYPPQQPPQLQGPPGAPRPEQLGIRMPDQDLLMMMRAPPQMSGPITGRISQGSQPSIPTTMSLGQPPFGNGYQLGAYPSHPQGHANRIVGCLQQDQRKNSLSKGATPQDLNRKVHDSTNSVTQSSTDSPVKDRTPTGNATLTSTSSSPNSGAIAGPIPQEKTGISFERDFGQWFNSGKRSISESPTSSATLSSTGPSPNLDATIAPIIPPEETDIDFG